MPTRRTNKLSQPIVKMSILRPLIYIYINMFVGANSDLIFIVWTDGGNFFNPFPAKLEFLPRYVFYSFSK